MRILDRLGKRGQVALGVVILAIAGALVYRSHSGTSPLPSEVNFVCLATGQTFTLDRERVTALPAKNPKTGQATLLPCEKREGKLCVDSHYRELVQELTKSKVNRYVDENTLAVKTAP